MGGYELIDLYHHELVAGAVDRYVDGAQLDAPVDQDLLADHGIYGVDGDMAAFVMDCLERERADEAARGSCYGFGFDGQDLDAVGVVHSTDQALTGLVADIGDAGRVDLAIVRGDRGVAPTMAGMWLDTAAYGVDVQERAMPALSDPDSIEAVSAALEDLEYQYRYRAADPATAEEARDMIVDVLGVDAG